MENLIKIWCPICGSVLSVQPQPGIESKSVTCPVCKNRSAFTQFKKIYTNDEQTEYPDQDDHTRYENGENTEGPSNGVNWTLGKITVPSLNISYQLKPGKNVIGRKATGSSAQCQIPCPSKRMSREHLIIEIKKVPGKGFVHYASLYKEQVNATFVGKNQLEYGDCIVLKDKDVIKLPDIEVRFIIPDEEGTEF